MLFSLKQLVWNINIQMSLHYKLTLEISLKQQ